MKLNKILKNAFLVTVACLVLSACATSKKSGQMQGDVYTGKDTVEYLASGVPDRVFFATNDVFNQVNLMFKTIKMEYKFLDREKELVEVNLWL